MESKTTPTMVNGLDQDALFDTLEAVKKDPKIAKFVFRAKNHWQTGGVNETVIKDYYGVGEEHCRPGGFHLVNDEPPELLGTDKAPNPVEYVLHAMAGCITTSLIAHATPRGIRIDEVATQFSGDLDVQGFLGLDPKVRNGYQAVKVELFVKGDADAATLEALGHFARSRSPVFDIVTNGVPVSLEVTAEPSAAAAA
jgi:uncharacterized OsmC-like protein